MMISTRAVGEGMKVSEQIKEVLAPRNSKSWELTGHRGERYRELQ